MGEKTKVDYDYKFESNFDILIPGRAICAC